MNPKKLIKLLSVLTLFLSGCAGMLPLSDDEYFSDPVEDAWSPFAEKAPKSVDPNREPGSERYPEYNPSHRESYRVSQAKAFRDVVLGMPMNDVVEIWGEPTVVDVAGDARAGNQKWTYYDGLSSRWSISTARVVFFEGGRVAGWETRRPD